MPTTTIGDAPYPAPTAADNVPADLEALAVWASTRVPMKFADTADRDGAIETPTPGMVAWLDAPGALTVRTASAWRTVWSALAWQGITLGGAYETYGTTPQITADGGNFLVLRGGVQKAASGVQITTGETLGSIPSSLGLPIAGDYPVATQFLTAVTGRLYVSATRTLQYIGSPVGWVSLNGVRIPLA